jgi:hypothetical protein
LPGPGGIAAGVVLKSRREQPMVRTQPVAAWLGVACVGVVLWRPIAATGDSGHQLGPPRVAVPGSDMPKAPGPLIIADGPCFKTYSLPDGNAEAAAVTLRALLGVSPELRIDAVDANTILVFAYPDDHSKIRGKIARLRAGTAKQADK